MYRNKDMAQMVEVKCKQCKEPFMAKVADRKRGWGKFCSKSCKAKKQELRTGQHRLHSERNSQMSRHEQDMEDSTSFHGQDDSGGV